MEPKLNNGYINYSTSIFMINHDYAMVVRFLYH